MTRTPYNGYRAVPIARTCTVFFSAHVKLAGYASVNWLTTHHSRLPRVQSDLDSCSWVSTVELGDFKEEVLFSTGWCRSYRLHCNIHYPGKLKFYLFTYFYYKVVFIYLTFNY